jgi:hypothetical protein
MAEDTRTEMNNEAMIQEMLRNSEKVELPSDLTDNPVIHRGDETLEAPMVVNKISSAGYVYVWDTRTYEKAPVLYYMLPAKMRQRRPDGSFRFTTVDPGKKPWRGNIKCRLHKEDPDRKHFDDLGFRYCNKENLVNPHALSQHMRLKHPQEWAQIEEERKDRIEKEDRELQRAVLGKIAQVEVKQGEVPLYISDKKPRGRPRK